MEPETYGTERDPRAAAAAGCRGPKAGVPPLRTNRGRLVHSSSKWAGPSCRPDVDTGDASSTLAPADPQAEGEGRGMAWGNGGGRIPHGAALPAPRLPRFVGVEAQGPPAQRGRRFLIPRKVRYGLAAALGLAQQDRTGSAGRSVGPGATQATVRGGKESRP